ncbi:MAG: arginine--tRNA ligase [Rhodospirillales bacterium 20-60-12]|nr:MAG: arginine--tRNA ligase [Rhodospirillales bacterium 20-60-12]HQT68246.1 arginine--tRNA ligase [Acetobacteraceae bacterium]
MSENLFGQIRIFVLVELTSLYPDIPTDVLARVEVTPTREAAHGDMATNAALVAAKPTGKSPREIAAALALALAERPEIAKAEQAGPGFVNITLAPAILLAQIPVILQAQEQYGSSKIGNVRRVNVEYVSANPTGPLHVGHCRGAVVGDALANLLAKAGFDVTKEYYINDAGAQVIALAWSVYWRYLQALGTTLKEGEFAEAAPTGLQYPGDYLIPVGAALAQDHGAALAGPGCSIAESALWLNVVRDAAIAAMMDLVREDLAALGVYHDIFTSEAALVAAGGVEHALATLSANDLLYEGVLEPPKGKTPEDWEPREQTLFKSTAFGDDIDRPVKKSDGSNTYFANDIAYHADKLTRGFTSLIDVWGADHGGYVKRMKAAVKAMAGARDASLDVVLCQIVRVMKDGVPMKMSKRAGTFVELRELIDAVGADTVRFIMLTRKSDAQMEFDLDAAVAQTRENPVFYVQYAHARCRSVLRAAAGLSALPEPDDLSSLDAAEELALIRRLISWPRAIEAAAEAHEPHRIAFFLYDLAGDFHALWNRGRENAALRFLQEERPVETAARLALVAATATVLRSGLAVLGVTPAEEMRG